MTKLQEELPDFVQMVCEYWDGALTSGHIDDIGFFQKCFDFYEKHKTDMPTYSRDEFVEGVISCRHSLFMHTHGGRQHLPVEMVKIIVNKYSNNEKNRELESVKPR
jgi:hypothetical protein